MTQYDLGQVVGAKGDDGVGIASIAKTSTSGLVDTYTITYDNGNTDTFTVTNGSSASVDIVTSFSGTTSDSKVPSERLTKTELDKKIATSNTSGLIKNDGSIMASGTGSSNWAVGNHTHSAYVNPTKVTSWSSTVSDNNVASEKLIKDSLDDKVSKSSTTGLLKNDGSVDTSSYLTTGSASSTYQPILTSGTNIKTVNNESLLGSGNITIQGGTSVDIVTSWNSTTSDSKVPSEKLTKTSLDGKLDNAVSSTAITIASNDNILVTDYSDSNKVKRVANILASQVKDSTAHTNIGSSASDTQSSINSSIDTALSNKISKSSTTGLLKNDGSVDTNSYLTTSSASSDYQTKLVSGTSIKTINNESLLGSGNITISSGGGGSDGEYFFSKDSFFDPNQWTGSPTISNGVITLSSDATFPLRLPPNCTLSFDLTVTNGYNELIYLLDTNGFEVNYDWLTGGVADITFTITNNYATISSEATGDEVYVTNASSKNGLTIPITNSTTATISNVTFTDNNRVTGSGGGSVDIVTAWETTPSDSKVASEKLVKDSLDLKSDSTHTHGNLSNDGKISTTSSATMVYFCGVGSSANTLYKSNKLSSDIIIDGTAHSNIGSSANDNQSTINAKIDTLIGQAISYINQ